MQRDVILFVEDNADDVKQTLRAFERNNIGNEVIVARDGTEALDYLFGTGVHAGRDISVQPGLVLLDLKLPRISGLDVLQRLRADDRTRHIPVVVLTSSWEERDRLRSYSLGANVYVRKPVQFTEFLGAARSLGLYWTLLASGLALLHREPPPPHPSSAPDVPRASGPASAADPGATWPMECLIATPDPRLAATVREVLVPLGHRAQHATDARTAFALVLATLPNVLIIDGALPDIHGIEVVRALRRSPHGDSVAAILLDPDVSTARRALADDAVRVLPRPLDPLALTEVIRQLGAERVWFPDDEETGEPGLR